MKKFRIKIDEKISVWQSIFVWVTAENQEEVEASLKDGSFMMKYEWDDVENGDVFLGTEENIDYDLSNYKIKEEIE